MPLELSQIQQIEPAERVEQLRAMYKRADTCVAHLLCDQHRADSVAYTVVDSDLIRRVVTYGDLKESSERFAAALAELGVGPGDRVATLMSKTADHLTALVGIWRLGAVHVPLFTAFAAPAIAMRLLSSATKVVVCDEPQRQKLAAGQDMPADPPWHIVVVGKPAAPGDQSFAELLAGQGTGFPAAALGGDAPIIQMYTSGTTGRPKGVVVPAFGLASFQAYGEFGFGLRDDDVFWNAADPGWGYGHFLGVCVSLSTGIPSVWLSAGFSAELTLTVMSELGVTNLGAAPTVYRQLRASGPPIPSDLRLRCVSSAGEPLTPEVNEWAKEALGVVVHDHYGQTETGMLINNHHHPALQKPLKPGSMGHAMPGWTAVVLSAEKDEPAPPAELGRIAFDLQASPLAWFTGYLDEPEKTAEKFSSDGRWYVTGDAGVVDDDGYFRFRSRDDDVIIMAGYRIGPFDVESVLLTHPAVTEAAAVAAPDELRGEVLEAYVVLRDGETGSTELADELKKWVKSKFAAHAYPRTVHFVPQLPKTPSGKVQRYVLRQRRRAELGGAS